MNIYKKSILTTIIYLLLSGITLIHFNCENQDSPASPPKVQWVVDSTLIPEIISKVDSNHIRTTIQTLQDFETRYAYSPKCYEAAQWIKLQLESYGYVVEDQPFQRYLFYDIFFADESNAWIVGKYGLILHSGDGGASWQKQNSPTNTPLRKVFFIDKTNGWIGGDSALLHTTNGGITWESVSGVSGNKGIDMFFFNEIAGWVCTDNALYYTSDGGSNWNIIYNGECRGVYFISDSVGYLCLTNSLQKTIDAGLTWSESFSITDSRTELQDIDFYNNNIGMIVSYGGLVYLSKDGGENWSTKTVDDQTNFTNCDIVNSDFYITISGEIYATYDGGNTWESNDITIPGEYMESIGFRNDREGFIVGISIFSKSIDSGNQWHQVPFEGIEESVLLHNIKAKKKGKINRDDRIVIGAHYDAISSGSFLTAPGANDNASGTAGVLEMARVMSEYDFDTGIDFVLFGHEEPPPHLLGSSNAAKRSAAENESIVEMINLDMIGYCPDDMFDIQVWSLDSQLRADFISRASTYSGIIVYEKDHYYSDEKSYGENGFTALSVSEYTYPSVRDYPWYHSSEDKIDKLNIGFTAEVVKFTLSGVCLKALPVIAK